MLGGGVVIVQLFGKRRSAMACLKCRKFDCRARDCMRPEICDMRGVEGHL